MNLRDGLPWLLGALLVVAAVIAWLWLTRPEENLLPTVYSVM